jgi:hypothetical protein
MSRASPKRVPAGAGSRKTAPRPFVRVVRSSRRKTPLIPPNAGAILRLEAALRADWQRVAATYFAAGDATLSAADRVTPKAAGES